MLSFSALIKKMKSANAANNKSVYDSRADENDKISRDIISWEEKKRAKERKQLQKDADKRNKKLRQQNT